MQNTMSLKMSASGQDLPAILSRLLHDGPFGDGAPLELSVDDEDKPPTPDWVEKWTPLYQRNVFATWDEEYERFVSLAKGAVVKAAMPDAPRLVQPVLSLLDALPFSLASFASIYDEWSEGYNTYIAPSFGDMHFPLGWACAFKGAGYEHLVSRRWLDFGPWHVVRGSGDTTLVQFHDLHADAATALDQARPGHERMGISDTGGFVQSGYVYAHDIDGLYSSDERRLRVLVHGREVTEREMLDACAVRRYQALGPSRPLESIAYVFADEGQARAHLHELWLRDLECWAIIPGREVRLDADYHPTPARPEWVQRLEEQGLN